MTSVLPRLDLSFLRDEDCEDRAMQRKPASSTGSFGSHWINDSSQKADRRRSMVQYSKFALVIAGAMMLTGAAVGLYFKSWAGKGSTSSRILTAYDERGHGGGPLGQRPGNATVNLQGAGGSVDDRLSGKLSELATPVREQFPWDQQLAEHRVCTDTCHRAQDGVCDDGREGLGRVYCDLGTDCTDCGAWDYLVPKDLTNFTLEAPIKELVAQGVEVRVAKTATVPSFLMPYSNPKQDVDVSGQMENGQVVELGLTQVWYMRLKSECARTGFTGYVKRKLVVDIGANFGYYSFYAASMGCRVIAWEPVPRFRHFMQYGIQLNRLQGLIHTRPFAASDKPGATYDMTVPQRGIWGTASIGGGNIDKNVNNEGDYIHIEVVGERVDAVVQQDVLLMKLDVEGFEPQAFSSARGILDGYKVENVMMEYSPGVYDTQNKWSDYPDFPKMLVYLLEHGFTMLHIADDLSRTPLLGHDFKGKKLPAFGEITAEHLAFDLEDAKKIQARTLGCPPPAELAELQPEQWGGCNFIPEDLHPKSFRACFGHNTNIWAVASREGLQVGPPVGIQSLEQPSTDWYSADPKYGLGKRSCQHLKPQLQVRHRCRCSKPEICGEEARLVERLAAEGTLYQEQIPLGLEGDLPTEQIDEEALEESRLEAERAERGTDALLGADGKEEVFEDLPDRRRR